MPLNLDMQGVMAIDIGFLKFFHILCERGTPKNFSELHLYLLPTLPHPLQIYQQYQEPHPIGPATLPAPCQLGATVSQVKAGKQPITYTQARTSAHASVSV